MARIRTIKPEFFTSEDIVSISPLARLLYIALWCEADKEGRLQWRPKTFKIRYLPADKCDIEDVCKEVVGAGLVVLYGDGLAHIPGFVKHQHVNPRESKSTLPEPPTHVERVATHIPADVRDAVIARDGGKCVRCGSEDSPQLDHILPQSCGGPHLIENLRVLCRSCNAGRPVQGQALVDDLAKDGFTLEMLRVKFGIDASIPDRHTQGGREGKGRKGTRVDDADGFESFWTIYPNRKARQDALKAWVKLDPDETLQASILKAVAMQSQGEDWRKEGGRFVPHASTWLNGGRWNDEPTRPVPTPFDDVFAGAK